RMPRTHGDSMVNVSAFDYMVYAEQELPEISSAGAGSEIFERIGKNVASLVEDGATLQTGIGSVPDAVLAQLETTAAWVFIPKCSQMVCCPWLKKALSPTNS